MPKRNNVFAEMKNIFSFAYLSAVWLKFGQNSIDIIENSFAMDFALFVTKQLINKQN